MDLTRILDRQARFRGGHEAVVFEGSCLSYAEFDTRVNQLANGLIQADVTKGDKVATLLPNCLELLCIYWACAKTGAVAVPLSPLLQRQAIINLLNQSEAAIVFAAPETGDALDDARAELKIADDRYVWVGPGSRPGYRTYADLVNDAPGDAPAPTGVEPEDPYNIIYSSGTTGEPKGITLSHRARWHYSTLYPLAWRMAPESVLLHTGALVFNGAFMTFLPAAYLGARYILHRAFDPAAVIETVRTEAVTHMMMVPTQIVALLNHPSFDPSAFDTLKCLVTIGAPLHLEHKQQVEAALPGRLHELYGLAEGFQTLLDCTELAEKLGSVGAPPPGFDLRIVGEDGCDLPAGEIGEIVGRGPILMSGYYNRPDLTAGAIRDGWLYSGDLGYVDEDGYLFLVDRKKDMFKSGGVSVYPRDIEDVVTQHPAVLEAVVFAVPDAKWGETGVAAVIADGTISPDDLRSWVNERVSAKFQRLSHVTLMESFPRNAAGKVVKPDLRDAWLAEYSGGQTS